MPQKKSEFVSLACEKRPVLMRSALNVDLNGAFVCCGSKNFSRNARQSSLPAFIRQSHHST
jgi:hypothetical protein